MVLVMFNTYAGGSFGFPLRKIKLKSIIKVMGPPCSTMSLKTLSNPSSWLSPDLTTKGEKSAPAPPETLMLKTASDVTMSRFSGLNQFAENCEGEFRMKTLPKATSMFPARTQEKLTLTRHLKATPIMTITQLMLHYVTICLLRAWCPSGWGCSWLGTSWMDGRSWTPGRTYSLRSQRHGSIPGLAGWWATGTAQSDCSPPPICRRLGCWSTGKATPCTFWLWCSRVLTCGIGYLRG